MMHRGVVQNDHRVAITPIEVQLFALFFLSNQGDELFGKWWICAPKYQLSHKALLAALASTLLAYSQEIVIWILVQNPTVSIEVHGVA